MDLIQRSQSGDLSAFAELFHQYKNLVFKTAYLLLGDPEHAEDALQEVFIRVHRSLASYQADRAAFSTWLYRITVNYCLNQRRRRFPTILPLGEVNPGNLPGQRSPEHQLAEDEALQQALAGLSDKLRAVVVLRYTWDLPYAEIAEILNIPIGTVKSRLSQALHALRDALQSHDSEIHLRGEVPW